MGFKREQRYLPIPSLEYRYEIDIHGFVRNARTRKKLRFREPRHQSEYVSLYLSNGRRVKRTVADLLWEVHGIEPERKFPTAKSVFVSKDGECLSFASYRQCVYFLMNRTSRKKTWLFRELQSKVTEIDGWRILYREPEERKKVTGAKANGDSELKNSDCL